MAKKGVFIVIDGTDGSGKATQTKLLVERLQKEGYPIETISFPQYGKKSAGLVEEYLSGAFGPAFEVGPHRASIFYAADRYAAAPTIRGWLDAGSIVVADRYVGSNMGHQGCHFENDEERRAFYEWNDALEHETFGIPRPDKNLILHVPADISLELIRSREEGNKHGGQTDMHENLEHLKKAERAYLHIANHFDSFHLIECVEEGQMKTREAIHETVWQEMLPLITSYGKTHLNRRTH